MDDTIGKRFSSIASRILFSAALCASLLLPAGLSAGAEDTALGDPVTDPLGVASFMPPEGWERWNFWGTTAFSPTLEHGSRITFAVTPDDNAQGNGAEKAMSDYESTFSTHNYTLVEKEYLHLNGWSGVRVLARGTEENALFGRDYIWIQEYFTGREKITLVFHSDPASFETYRDAVLKSFRSLVITERGQDGS
jgi:hypothetical protein